VNTETKFVLHKAGNFLAHPMDVVLNRGVPMGLVAELLTFFAFELT